MNNVGGHWALVSGSKKPGRVYVWMLLTTPGNAPRASTAGGDDAG